MSFVKLIQESCHLGDEIRHRLYDRVFSDMVVRTGDGRDHRVHRLVLAAASPFVRGLLLQASEEELPVVVLPDFTSESFTSLLPCLYGGFRESDRQPDPEIARLLRVGPWAPAHDKPLSPRSSVQPAENHHENSGGK
jgi:hypothetical protein